MAQAHLEDGVRLPLCEPERPNQRGFGPIGFANDANDLVEVEVDEQESVEQVHTLLDRLAPVLKPTPDRITPVVEPLAQELGQTEHFRPPVETQDIEVEAVAGFKVGFGKEMAHQALGVAAS